MMQSPSAEEDGLVAGVHTTPTALAMTNLLNEPNSTPFADEIGGSEDLQHGDGILVASDLSSFVADPFTVALNDSALQRGSDKRIKPFMILVSCVAACSGILYGLDLGGIGASFLMQSFRYHFDWSCEDGKCYVDKETIDRDKGFISLFFGLGATVGSLVSPYFAEKHGRRPCLSLSTLVYIAGAALQTTAANMQVLWLGRFVTVTGIGMLSMVAPVYIAESAPQHARGALGIFYDLATVSGISVAAAANLGLKEWHAGWKMAYGLGLVFAAILLFSLLAFMPESPRWLCANATEEEMLKSLSQLRYEDELQAEKIKLQGEIQEAQELGEASWREVFSNSKMMRRRVLLGFFFFAIQQLSGGSAVHFYAPDILNTFFSEDEAILWAFGLTLVTCVSTALTAVVVDRYGRTKLLVYGGAMMTACLFLLAFFSTKDDKSWTGWVIIVTAVIYYVAFALSWGPTLYVLCAEIFPYRTRGKATGLTTMSHWLAATIVGAVFPVASTVSLTSCFVFFGFCALAGTLTVYFLQVETNGMTSAQIDEAFLNHKPTFKRKDW